MHGKKDIQDFLTLEEAYKIAKGERPKDAPKLPKGWHYMPDGKVMSEFEHMEMKHKEEFVEKITEESSDNSSENGKGNGSESKY